MTFESFSFDRRIRAGIQSCGYTTPTPIQTQAIPKVLQGNDVMGLAQTGTGKTAAFALPILQRLLQSGKPFSGAPRTLVLAPTRELALQIHENFTAMAKETNLRSGVVIGGVGFNPQIQAFRRCAVIVACPGRLVRLIKRGEARLDQIDTLVLDEADRMLDMGFMPDIKRVLAQLPKQRQNLLFSATMPKDIRKLADTILVNPTTVQVANTAPAKSVEHEFYPVKPHLKARLLETLLDKTQHESVLIFTRTKHKAKALARKLAQKGHEATFLQGNMSQNQRQRALNGFREGKFNVMVATDIAARGIDCERITHVINFDVPDTAETYTHRIGRTGRAGRGGQALSLITREDRDQVRAIERILKARVDHRTIDGFDYDTPAPPRNERGNGRGRNKPKSFGRKPRNNGGGRSARGRKGAPKQRRAQSAAR